MDLRYERTEKMLKESALRLGEKKDIYSLSVTEICKEAMVSRIAFYDHYDNTEALLERIEDEVVDRFIQEIMPFTDFFTAPNAIIHRVVDYYKRNEFAVFSKSSRSSNLTRKGIRRIVEGICSASNDKSVEFETRVIFLINGILGVSQQRDITDESIIRQFADYARIILK